MIEFCSKKRMLGGIILLGGLTLIVLIYESHWAFEASSYSHFGNYSNLAKNNSVQVCLPNEDYTVVQTCHPCSDFEIASSSNNACIPTHYKEAVKCHISGRKAYRSCDRVQWLEERKFWQFESFVLVCALTSSASVVLRQRILDHKHLKALQRRIASSMGHLYLEVFEVENDLVEAPVESGICLLVLKCLGLPSQIKVHFILGPIKRPKLRLNLSGVDFDVVGSAPLPASLCSAPSFLLDDGLTCVAGLCAVLRQIVKSSDKSWRHLLGFREACLVSCAEVSVWTKFCEVDLVKSAEEVLASNVTSMQMTDLARFEAHLAQPIRIHNIRKFKETSHKFAEGPFFLLTDLLLALPVFVIMEMSDAWTSPELALTVQWFNVIMTEGNLKNSLYSLVELPNRPHINFSFPHVPSTSLYKRDPKRYKPREKIFTQQSDIDSSLEIISKVEMVELTTPVGAEIRLPPLPDPDVPQSRLARKMEQLDNLAKAAVQVSRNDDLIVDFCCGSGHLGLILAQCLPSSRVILVDNKEKSLDRARERISEMKLSNVYVVQTNLDYFIGAFDVGVTLHACGVASDLVINKCLRVGANLVICPCCYGGIQTNHVIGYPQSEEYRQVGLSEKGYIVLGHCADQINDQGENAMRAVDSDRCYFAQSHGYDTFLSKLIPPTCTTRNNLIVAVKQKGIKV